MSTPLLENILNQPAALMEVGRYHLGAGRDALVRAAALVTAGKRVIVSGMGASFFAALPFAYRLSSRGLCVVPAEASELLYFLESQLDSESTVLLVSRSGESVEVSKLLRVARERGASVLGVTNIRDSTLAREADHAIWTASPPDELVAIQTYVATAATLALLDATINGELNAADSDLKGIVSVLARWIPQCVEARETWRAFLDTDRALYLLGRGPTSSSIAEGALLMHEVAKSAAVAMSVAQFRHGPVEVVDSSFRAIVWGTQAATAALDAGLVNDLVRMGGQVRWVGPARPDLDNVTAACGWPPEIPSRFLSIAEIIPLQLAAYTKAELLGIRPGDFRWAPAITASESGFPVMTPL